MRLTVYERRIKGEGCMTTKKQEEETMDVPIGGYLDVWNSAKVNQLVLSGQYFVKETCNNGKYILVRKA